MSETFFIQDYERQWALIAAAEQKCENCNMPDRPVSARLKPGCFAPTRSNVEYLCDDCVNTWGTSNG
jgi:hypothetical protein